jgi:peptidoglycan/xylan/chitin deacetylase (PgdA/CDA1 family)
VDPRRDSRTSREERRAHEVQVRRRRAAWVVFLCFLVAAGAAGLAKLASGGDAKHTATKSSSTRTSTSAHPPKPKPKPALSPKQKRAAAKRRLEQRGNAVIDRLAREGHRLYCGGGKGRYVALTFDDGPGPYTERYALRILRQAELRATFFIVGRNIAHWPTTLKRELAFGALGDHTWTHPYLPALSPKALKSELASTQTEIQRVTGQRVRLFRPPYGARNAAVDHQAQALGMLEVLWSIDSRDSLGANWLGIAKNVIANLHSGSIVLMHENRGQTIRALKFKIIPALKRRHYKTVSLPELMALDPPSQKQLRTPYGGCAGQKIVSKNGA